jgi:hypothetical protein
MKQAIRHQKPFKAAIAWLIVSAAALIGGCAAPAESTVNVAPSTTSPSPVDHVALASIYEQQGRVDAEHAERHLRYVAVYRRNQAPSSDPSAHEVLARHCETLAQTYLKSSAENAALASAHRKLAAGSR